MAGDCSFCEFSQDGRWLFVLWVQSRWQVIVRSVNSVKMAGDCSFCEFSQDGRWLFVLWVQSRWQVTVRSVSSVKMAGDCSFCEFSQDGRWLFVLLILFNLSFHNIADIDQMLIQIVNKYTGKYYISYVYYIYTQRNKLSIPMFFLNEKWYDKYHEITDQIILWTQWWPVRTLHWL